MERPLVKGSVLIDAIAVVRNRYGDAGLQAVLVALDAETQEVLRGKLLANDWYPLDVMTSFMAAGVRIHSGGDESVIVDRAERVIERQLGGIYRIFIRLGSPEHIIRRLGGIHQTYFEHVDVAPLFTEERRARVRYTGFGPQHRIMEPAIVGFYRKALQLSGAKDVTARITAPLSEQNRVLEVEIAWS
jgi:hypothetical protein